MSRWRPTRAFADLIEYVQWFSDYGKNTACCRTAAGKDFEANFEKFNCDTCQVKAYRASLTAASVSALELYAALASSALSACSAQGWILDRWMAGWALDDVLAMLRRLDAIHDVLSPRPHG